MKLLTLTAAVGVVALAFALPGLDASAQDDPGEEEPAIPMMNPESMVQQCTAMMKNAGVDEETIHRWRVMMHTPIFLDSPCAVYGQAEALGISEEQKQKLIEVENEARKAALSVLTDDQRRQVGDLPDGAKPMIEVCVQMRGSMMPMMQMMMGGDTSDMMQKMQQMMSGNPSEEPGPSKDK